MLVVIFYSDFSDFFQMFVIMFNFIEGWDLSFS